MRKRPEVWAKWRGLVSEQKRSGQSVAAFCREHGVCAPQLFAWKKRLGQAAAQGFVSVQVTEDPPATAGPAIEVRLSGGRSVIVEPGFDAVHLRAVLDVLETRV